MQPRFMHKANKSTLNYIIYILICIILPFISVTLSTSSVLKLLDHMILEYICLPIRASKDIVLIKIDDRTLKEMNKAWGPCWREQHSQLLANLKNAKIVAWDITFDGPTEYDEQFATRIRSFHELGESQRGNLERIVIATRNHTQIPQTIAQYTSQGFTHFNYDLDKKVRYFRPYTIREIPADTYLANQYYELSFAYVIYEESRGNSYKGKSTVLPTILIQRDIDFTFPHCYTLIDDQESILIRSVSSNASFTSISYSDVYANNFDHSMTENKIVIIGAESNRTGDFHNTSYGPMSGLMLNALSLNTLLNAACVRPLPVLLQISIFAIFCATLTPLLSGNRIIPATMVIILVGMNVLYLALHNRYVSFANICILTFLIFIICQKYLATHTISSSKTLITSFQAIAHAIILIFSIIIAVIYPNLLNLFIIPIITGVIATYISNMTSGKILPNEKEPKDR